MDRNKKAWEIAGICILAIIIVISVIVIISKLSPKKTPRENVATVVSTPTAYPQQTNSEGAVSATVESTPTPTSTPAPTPLPEPEEFWATAMTASNDAPFSLKTPGSDYSYDPQELKLINGEETNVSVAIYFDDHIGKFDSIRINRADGSAFTDEKVEVLDTYGQVTTNNLEETIQAGGSVRILNLKKDILYRVTISAENGGITYLAVIKAV